MFFHRLAGTQLERELFPRRKMGSGLKNGTAKRSIVSADQCRRLTVGITVKRWRFGSTEVVCASEAHVIAGIDVAERAPLSILMVGRVPQRCQR